MTSTSRGFLLSEINSAAEKGDLEKVKALVKGDSDLIFKASGYGDLPLNWTVMGGHKDVAAFLLANKANVNGTNSFGWSPLHYAACGGYQEVADLLITQGANIESRNTEGETPLWWAARNGQKDMVQWLLDHKADVNTKDNQGMTPLNMAVFYEHKEVEQLLLARGAAGNIFYAIQSGDLKMLEDFLKDDPGLVSGRDKWGDAPLHLAVSKGRADMVKLLLASKADVNVRNSNNDTPLHMVTTGDMAELLLTNKAEVNVKDKSGNTSLHYAVLNKHEDVANRLRAHGGQE